MVNKVNVLLGYFSLEGLYNSFMFLKELNNFLCLLEYLKLYKYLTFPPNDLNTLTHLYWLSSVSLMCCSISDSQAKNCQVQKQQ